MTFAFWFDFIDANSDIDVLSTTDKGKLITENFEMSKREELQTQYK